MDPGWLQERLAPAAELAGVAVGPDQAALLAAYASLLLAWNRRINLTGARDAAALADAHLADALFLLPHLPAGPFRGIDVGSGGGLPGLAIACLRADAELSLLEPVHKKHAFLAAAIRELGLGGRVRALAERDEAHRAAEPAPGYDVALSRAVWPAAEWLARGARLVRPGGRVLAQTGADPGALPATARVHPYRSAARSGVVIRLDV